MSIDDTDLDIDDIDGDDLDIDDEPLVVAVMAAGERIGSGLEAVAKAIDRLAEAVREGQL